MKLKTAIIAGVGVLVLAAIVTSCASCKPSEPSKITARVVTPRPATAPAVEPSLESMAKENQTEFIENCFDNYKAHYHDYTCVFIKQERLGSKLSPLQRINTKCRENPYSVAMHWQNPIDAVAVLYVQGQNGNKMLARPTGIAGFLISSVKLDPGSREALKTSQQPITEFSFDRQFKAILVTNKQAQDAGALKLRYEGIKAVPETGKPAFVIVREISDEKIFPAAKTTFYFDTEYLVPTRAEGYDAKGNLHFLYTFEDLQFNVGLKDSDFTPQANGIAP